MSNEDDKVTIYETDIDEDLWNDIEEKVKKLDPAPPSRKKYSRKEINRKALRLLDHMLSEEFKDAEASIDRVKRKMNELEDVVADE